MVASRPIALFRPSYMRRLLSSTEEITAWSRISIDREDFDRNALVSLVRGALTAESPWRSIASLSNKDAQLVMDVLQEELDLPLTDGTYRSKCIKCLSALGKSHNVLPASFLCGDVRRMGNGPVSGGGFADIWKGTRDSTGAVVCLKALRVFELGRGREDTLKAFYDEALIWRQLRHHHVLPLLGVSTDELDRRFYLISPWMSNGNIMDFLTVQPQHDRFQSVLDIGKGIQYLHGLDPPVLHADLRGANILVAEDLRCVLADFGISMIASETQSPGSATRRKGTIRWMPPEMLQDFLFEPQYLLARDIYAFGCTILEIYTGQPPFPHLKSDGSVITNVLLNKGKPARPPREDFPSDALWSLVTDCMSWHAKDRPSATRILHLLLRMQEQSSAAFVAQSAPATRVCTPTSLGSSSGSSDVGSDSGSDSVHTPPPSAQNFDLSVSFMVNSSSEEFVNTPQYPPSAGTTKETTVNPRARFFALSWSRNESRRLNPEAQIFSPPRSTTPPLNPCARVFIPRGSVTRAAGGLNPNVAVFSPQNGQQSGRNLELPLNFPKKTLLSPYALPFTPCRYDERPSALSPNAAAFTPRLGTEVKKNLNADACVFHPRSRYHGTFEIFPS